MMEPVPVTIVGGYLGAGKTTLINRLLSGRHGRRLTVLVNDFGEVNIDAGLIERHDGETIALTNGCVCCSIAGDLGAALKQAAEAVPAPDHIVVEASGIADPARTANYARGWPQLRLAGTVVLVDGATIRERIDDKFVGTTLRRQIDGGDLLLLSKTDILTPDGAAEIQAWLERLAPALTVLPSVRGSLPMDLLLGDLAREADSHEAHGAEAMHDHAERDYISGSWRPNILLDRKRFLALLQDAGPDLLRCKGWLRFSDQPDELSLLQAVGPAVELSVLPPERDEACLLVFILRRGGLAPEELVRRLEELGKGD